jgi:hypothetical protein
MHRNRFCASDIASTPCSHYLRNWLYLLLAFTLAFACVPAQADEADDQYLEIFRVIDRGDSLHQNGQTNLAKARYEEAQISLMNLKKNYPNWNTKAVAYRLNYVGAKLAALSPAPAPAEPSVELEKKEAKTESKNSGTAEVKLISAGAEPRKTLRLRAQPGDKQTMDMMMKIAMDMQMGEMPGQTIKMPPVKMTTEVTVKDVSSDGDIDYEMVITDATVIDDPDVLPQVATVMKGSLGSVKGFSTSGKMSSRGINKGIDAKMPGEIDPQVRQSVEQVKEALANASSPLPEEAVGPGAKWEVKMSIKSQGMTIQQVMSYELVSVEGDQIKLSTVISQNAANQKIENPAMPGLKVDVTKMTGEGKGTLTMDLAKVLPLRAVIDSDTEMSMGMNMGSQKQSMVMKMDLNVQMESK